jgi:hypothetical protein
MQDYLMDKFGTAGGFLLEHPRNDCPCLGTGLVAGDWVFGREPECTCPVASDDFVFTLHGLTCDAVPCPFCPLEGKSCERGEYD